MRTLKKIYLRITVINLIISNNSICLVPIFREKSNPRYITEINQCPVLNVRVDAELVHLRQLIDSLDDRNDRNDQNDQKN